jgi:hypothetical protein
MKNGSRTHWESKNELFFPKLYSTKTLGIEVYKIINCHKDPMPCTSAQDSKLWNLWVFGPLKKQVPK